MIGIAQYNFETGRYSRSIEDIACGLCTQTELENMRFIGLERAYTDNERTINDMIYAACNGILQDTRPDLVILAHSLPFIRANGSDIMPYAEGVPVIILSGLPCVIMHRAIMTASKMIRAGLYDSVLVIGADKAYSDRERIFFGTVMSDCAIALLIRYNCMEHSILASHVSTTVIAPYGENSDDNDIKKFRASNVQMMREAMRVCREKAGLDKVDYYVPHTSNGKFWDAVSDLCRIERSRFLDGNIRMTGHMNSHDSFYHYMCLCEDGTIKPGMNVMLINPGFGGSQGCTLIRR